MLNKVPEVTIYFWLIKILCTTVGETAADDLNTSRGFGLTNTTWVAAGVLIALLIAQFRTRQYRAPLYWSVVVVISVFGTLITDNLTDSLGVSRSRWGPRPGTWSARSLPFWLADILTRPLGASIGDEMAQKEPSVGGSDWAQRPPATCSSG